MGVKEILEKNKKALQKLEKGIKDILLEKSDTELFIRKI